MTPTLAFASSSAMRWASVAPAIVSLNAAPFLTSTSCFREMRVAIMSALATLTTNGSVP